MSKPVLLATLSLVVGIVAAHILFYEASVAVPVWLGACAWGFCCLLALLGWRLNLSSSSSSFSSFRFLLVTMLFFFVLGFARYAFVAQDIRQSWQAMEHPPSNRGNPDEFDYRRWRWVQGVESAPSSLVGRVRRCALVCRQRLLDRYALSGLEGETLAIVAASTLGDRSLLQRETRDLYSDAGAAHLLALSGLHLGILVGFLLSLLNGRLLLSRWRSGVGGLLLLFIWSYAFLAGLPTSLVRASSMMSVFVIASLLQRYGAPLQHLLLTGFCMLLLSPLYLFDVGAQLSFLSVAGILVVHRRLADWVQEHFHFGLYWLQRYHLSWPLTLFSVSLSAQLFTLPLVMYYFHQFSPYTALFSVLFVPLTTVLIFCSMAVLLTSFLLPSLSTLLSVGLSALVAVQLSVMRFEVSLPFAVVHDFWSRKAEPQLIVYHSRRCPALHLIASPSRSWLLMPEPDSLEVGLKSISATFWARRLTAAPVVLRGRKSLATGTCSAVMLDVSASASRDKITPPEMVDLLWVTNKRVVSLADAARLWHPRLLVLDASLPSYQRKTLAQEAETLGWKVYDVAEQGAFRVALGGFTSHSGR